MCFLTGPRVELETDNPKLVIANDNCALDQVCKGAIFCCLLNIDRFDKPESDGVIILGGFPNDASLDLNAIVVGEAEFISDVPTVLDQRART